jgi:hypothetical protein
MPGRLSRIVVRASDAARACESAWRNGGVREVWRLASGAVYWRYNPKVRRWAMELPAQQQIDEDFDRRFGVDTAGEVPLAQVGITGPDVQRGHAQYRPVWTSVFHEALGRLHVDFQRFTFLDYGSGKGKALLLASAYPFREIIGIEFARPLHETAARNVERYSAATQRCRALRSECVDALHFEPPSGPLVCFFFNPFDEATMAGVLERLSDSVRRDPREVLIVYCNMRSVRENGGTLRAKACLSLLAQHAQYLLFRVSAS